MKVLILGSKGNLGSQLLHVFGDDNHEVIGWDKEDIDITDRDLIIKKIEEVKPSVVINTAAYNAVDNCEEEADFKQANGTQGTERGEKTTASEDFARPQ